MCNQTINNIFEATQLCHHTSRPARIMTVQTPHGRFETPTFMPVGTRASINGLEHETLQQTGTQIILGGNTYHMLIAPGLETIQRCGGMHNLMNWPGPMLTDSGGFQVFSLSKKGTKMCRIKETGAFFPHPHTGAIIHLDPAQSIGAQKIIGADIIMAFDQCTPESGGREIALRALQRTHAWLQQSREAHDRHPRSVYGKHQALFGIIQGGQFRDLREQSMQFILSQDLDGIAIGGEVVGFDIKKTQEILSWIVPHLPEKKIRYTMGVGLNPQDLIDVVHNGVDIFDCVAPTRNARHGALYYGYPEEKGDWLFFNGQGTPTGRLLIKKGIYAHDERPILETCKCHTCRAYSRAYLHYLFKTKQSLYERLATIHNIHVMQDLCATMRAVIKKNAHSTKMTSA